MRAEKNLHPAVKKLLTILEREDLTLFLSVGRVAPELGVSASYLQHLLRRNLNLTYSQLVRQRRVRLAQKALLERPDLSIAEVAAMLEYESPTLYRHFKSELGMSPSEVRRQAAGRGALTLTDRGYKGQRRC